MYGYNPDGSLTNCDATVTNYNNVYSNFVNSQDALKIPQLSESICVVRNDTAIAIERRKIIANTDTSFIVLGNMQIRNYKFDIVMLNLNHPGLTAVLQDSYTNFSTPLNLNGTTTVEFTILSNTSSAAPNRFRIVYSAVGVLPVNFTGATVVRTSNGAGISWTTANEINLQQFEVERSQNGKDFSLVQQLQASRNQSGTATYTVQDRTANNGIYFYRIRAISVGGRIQYSAILKLAPAGGISQLTVYPNPVKDNIMNLQFVNMPKGDYTLRLVNNAGVLLQNSKINHTGSNAAQSIAINNSIANGYYHLQILLPNGEKQTQTVLIAK